MFTPIESVYISAGGRPRDDPTLCPRRRQRRDAGGAAWRPLTCPPPSDGDGHPGSRHDLNGRSISRHGVIASGLSSRPVHRLALDSPPTVAPVGWSLAGVGAALLGITATAVVVADVLEPDEETQHVVITRVIDGDTVEIDSGDHVRLIGMDTPGARSADTSGLRRPSLGFWRDARSPFVSPDAVATEDRYGRLLRYVDQETVDAGYEMIVRGHAIARDDSQDGYDAHPRETSYRAADADNDTLCERREEERAEARARARRWEDARWLARRAGIHRRPGETADELTRRAQQVILQRQARRDPIRKQPPPPAPTPPAPWQPPPGWTTDALTPGYSGCRQGYPGGRVNGVYVWKPIPYP